MGGWARSGSYWFDEASLLLQPQETQAHTRHPATTTQSPTPRDLGHSCFLCRFLHLQQSCFERLSHVRSNTFQIGFPTLGCEDCYAVSQPKHRSEAKDTAWPINLSLFLNPLKIFSPPLLHHGRVHRHHPGSGRTTACGIQSRLHESHTDTAEHHRACREDWRLS